MGLAGTSSAISAHLSGPDRSTPAPGDAPHVASSLVLDAKPPSLVLARVRRCSGVEHRPKVPVAHLKNLQQHYRPLHIFCTRVKSGCKSSSGTCIRENSAEAQLPIC